MHIQTDTESVLGRKGCDRVLLEISEKKTGIGSNPMSVFLFNVVSNFG